MFHKKPIDMKTIFLESDYAQDFPAQGAFNWKTAKIHNCDDSYYNGVDFIGVLLHDGNFKVKRLIFEPHEFTIIDENPLQRPPVKIQFTASEHEGLRAYFNTTTINVTKLAKTMSVRNIENLTNAINKII